MGLFCQNGAFLVELHEIKFEIHIHNIETPLSVPVKVSSASVPWVSVISKKCWRMPVVGDRNVNANVLRL